MIRRRTAHPPVRAIKIMRNALFPLVLVIFLQTQTKPILTSQLFESKSQVPSASAASTRGSFSPDLHLRSRRRRVVDSESEIEDDKEIDEIALAKLFLGPKANRTRDYGVDIEYCRPQNEWFKSWPENEILPGKHCVDHTLYIETRVKRDTVSIAF